MNRPNHQPVYHIETTLKQDQENKQAHTVPSGHDPLEFLSTEQLQKYFIHKQTKDSIPINQREKADHYSNMMNQRNEHRAIALTLFSESKYEQALPHCKKLMSIAKSMFNAEEPDKKDIFEYSIGHLFYIKCLLKTDNIELCRRYMHSLWLFVDKVIQEDTIVVEMLRDKSKLAKLKGTSEFNEFSEKFQNYLFLVSKRGQFVKNIEETLHEDRNNGVARSLFVNIQIRRRTSLLSLMAAIFYSIGEFKMTESVYCKYTILIEKNFGEKSAETSNCYFLIGVFYMQHKLHKKAMACFRTALEIRESKFGKFHECISDCYFNIAIIYKQMLKRQKAIQCLNNVLEIRKELIGATSLSVAVVYELLGKIYLEDKDYKSALLKFQEVYIIRKAIISNDMHPEIKRVADLLEDLQRMIANEIKSKKIVTQKGLVSSINDQIYNKTFKLGGQEGNTPMKQLSFGEKKPDLLQMSSFFNKGPGLPKGEEKQPEQVEMSLGEQRMTKGQGATKQGAQAQGKPNQESNKTDPVVVVPFEDSFFGKEESNMKRPFEEMKESVVASEDDPKKKAASRISDLTTNSLKFVETLGAGQLKKFSDLCKKIKSQSTDPNFDMKKAIISSEFFDKLSQDQVSQFKSLNRQVFG